MELEKFFAFAQTLDDAWEMVYEKFFHHALDNILWRELMDNLLGERLLAFVDTNYSEQDGYRVHYRRLALLDREDMLLAQGKDSPKRRSKTRRREEYIFGFEVTPPGGLQSEGFNLLHSFYTGWLQRRAFCGPGELGELNDYFKNLRQFANRKQGDISGCFAGVTQEWEVERLWRVYRELLSNEAWFRSHIQLRPGDPLAPMKLSEVIPRWAALETISPVLAQKFPELNARIEASKFDLTA